MNPFCILNGLLILSHFSKAIPTKSRLCSRGGYPFTGYVLENRISMTSPDNEYHLVYCNNNKLIFDRCLGEEIPWTRQISFGRNVISLARRKSFALREIPLYIPHSLVGAIFVGPQNKSSPLVADSIFRHSAELNHSGELIFHIPILTTPRIDSKKFQMTLAWDMYISPSENYTYEYDSRNTIRQSLDHMLHEMNSRFDGSSGNIFLDLATLSKHVTVEQYENIIGRLTKFLT